MVIAVNSGIALPGTPGAAGLTYVVSGADNQFDVTVTFQDSSGAPLPLTTSGHADLTLSASPAGPVRGLPVTKRVPADTTSATFEDLWSVPVTGLTLTASADITGKATIPDATLQFDVLIDSTSVTAGRTAIGGAGGTDQECNATPEQPMCGDLLPPATGGFGPNGLLSNGLCGVSDAECRATYVQALVEINEASPTNPATLIMKCDKTLCGGGAIKDSTLSVQLKPTSERVTAAACPAKGTVGTYDADDMLATENAPFCVDYVQSTRDNAGDTLLYLLFYIDAKVRWM